MTVSVPVTYHRVWKDGFGARGWKLDCSIGDPVVIAATAETGLRIPTSVLVHDLLDHHLCGIKIGGHANEAIALIQLEHRTGSNPRPDIRQMIEEDLLQGCVNGQPMREFLPPSLLALVPKDLKDDQAIIAMLRRRLGRARLGDALEYHLLALGHAGDQRARRHFESLGLRYECRQQIGICLQRILTRADTELLEASVDSAFGKFVVGNDYCDLKLTRPQSDYRESVPPLPHEVITKTHHEAASVT